MTLQRGARKRTMAAKAYVVSMTVSELKDELKQRGLSTKGSKKDLRDRLEQALYDEELDDPESEVESESATTKLTVGGGFNFEVPPESFIAEEDVLAECDEAESMIVSVQLSNRDRLEVHPCGNASSRMAVGVGDRTIGDRSLSPMIITIKRDAKDPLGGVADRQLGGVLDPVRVSDGVANGATNRMVEHSCVEEVKNETKDIVDTPSNGTQVRPTPETINTASGKPVVVLTTPTEETTKEVKTENPPPKEAVETTRTEKVAKEVVETISKPENPPTNKTKVETRRASPPRKQATTKTTPTEEPAKEKTPTPSPKEAIEIAPTVQASLETTPTEEAVKPQSLSPETLPTEEAPKENIDETTILKPETPPTHETDVEMAEAPPEEVATETPPTMVATKTEDPSPKEAIETTPMLQASRPTKEALFPEQATTEATPTEDAPKVETLPIKKTTISKHETLPIEVEMTEDSIPPPEELVKTTPIEEATKEENPPLTETIPIEEATKEVKMSVSEEATRTVAEAAPKSDKETAEMEFSVHVEEDDFSNEDTSRSREPSTSTSSKRGREDVEVTSSIKKRRVSAATSSAATTPTDRKRKWGSGRQRVSSGSAPAINSDLIQDIIPVEVSQLAELGQLDDTERGTSEEPSPAIDEEKNKEEELRAHKELETRRRIEARLKAKREAELIAKQQEHQRTPSPAKHAPSRILHVKGLTRPFTKEELRELLARDGTPLEEAFWIDKIRSHCVAVYDTQDIAVATRARVHGVKWPTTNPKYLSVDYLSSGEVARVTDGQLVIQEEEDKVALLSPQAADVEPPPIAMDTAEEVAPSKPTLLLDELFRKTKTAPYIYWLPLTDAQIAERLTAVEEKEKERDTRRAAWMAQRKEENRQRREEEVGQKNNKERRDEGGHKRDGGRGGRRRSRSRSRDKRRR